MLLPLKLASVSASKIAKRKLVRLRAWLEVVEFLNKLYTEFDSRIDLYDVYKVETVGDAYMIVSGCPRTNGIRHAGELATLALDLLNMTHHFKIPHKPDAKLMLRIGLHSGNY